MSRASIPSFGAMVRSMPSTGGVRSIRFTEARLRRGGGPTRPDYPKFSGRVNPDRVAGGAKSHLFRFGRPARRLDPEPAERHPFAHRCQYGSAGSTGAG